jgi:hypothetical protein
MVCALGIFPFIISSIELFLYNSYRYLLSIATGVVYKPKLSYENNDAINIDNNNANNIFFENDINNLNKYDIRPPRRFLPDYQETVDYINQKITNMW